MVILGAPGDQPAGVHPHLVVRLRRGWTYRAEDQRFVSEEGGEFAPGEELPPGSRIVATVPNLAAKRARRRTQDEEQLASSIMIVLPIGTEPQGIIARVERWTAVQTVELPPEVSLP